MNHSKILISFDPSWLLFDLQMSFWPSYNEVLVIKNVKSALEKYKYAHRYKFEYVEFEKVWPIPSY